MRAAAPRVRAAWPPAWLAVLALLAPATLLAPRPAAAQQFIPSQKAYVGRDGAGNLLLNSTLGRDVIVNGEDVLRTLSSLRDLVSSQQDAILALQDTVEGQRKALLTQGRTIETLTRAVGGNLTARNETLTCAVWGMVIPAVTGIPGSCELPTEWDGDLVLEEWLIPMVHRVEVVTGDLDVTRLPSLRSLSGVFSSLTQVTGHLSISSNAELQSLDGFERLERVGGDMNVAGVFSITSMDAAFPALLEVGGYLNIGANGNLVTAKGAFPQLQTVRRWLRLQGNGKLQNASGLFGSLAFVGGYVVVQDNFALQRMPSFRIGGTKVNGTFLEVRGNDAMSNFGGLKNLECTHPDGCGLLVHSNPKSKQNSICNILKHEEIPGAKSVLVCGPGTSGPFWGERTEPEAATCEGTSWPLGTSCLFDGGK